MNSAIRIAVNLSLAGLCVSACRQDKATPLTDISQLQPLTGMRVRPGHKFLGLPGGESNKWIEAFVKTTGKDATAVFLQMSACCDQARPLFDGDKFKPEISAMMLKRINSLTQEDFGPLLDACNTATGKQCNDTTWAADLLSVGLLFNGDAYSAAAGKKYLGRLKQLNPAVISRWCNKLPAFQDDELSAALTIATLDRFFDGDKFDLAAFDKALGS